MKFNNRIYLPVLLLVAAYNPNFFFRQPHSEEVDKGKVSGVVQSVGGTLLPKARVFFTGATGFFDSLTDSSGKYAVDLPPGSYQMRVEDWSDEASTHGKAERSIDFCPTYRAKLTVKPSTATTINFIIQFLGEPTSAMPYLYLKPGKRRKPVLPACEAAHLSRLPIYDLGSSQVIVGLHFESLNNILAISEANADVMIQYGDKLDSVTTLVFTGNAILETNPRFGIPFPATVLSSGSLTVYANVFKVNKKSRIISALGHVVADSNGTLEFGDAAEMRWNGQQLEVALTPRKLTP